MKKADFIVLFAALILFAPFFLYPPALNSYKLITSEYPMLMSFLKFALLATFGETLGLRIKTGRFNQKGFGILPRALVWGFLGLTIQMAFVIFSTGTPLFLVFLGMENAPEVFADPSPGWGKIAVAFSVSVAMNIFYAPVMMTMHKITDTHIENGGGTLRGLFKPMNTGKILSSINWQVQWDFVFARTIPFFWIPAHTLTFMLPVEFRVLFAAVLGIALGIILAVAAIKNKSAPS